MENNIKDILKTASRLGRAILECGGEVYRVEDSMERFFSSFNISNPQIFAIPATIITTVEDSSGEAYTITERIRSIQTNMDRLDKVNSLCRKACTGHISPDQINSELDIILSDKNTYSSSVQIAGYRVASSFFCLFWGGSFRDFIVAAFAGTVTKLVLNMMSRVKSNIFFSNFCASLSIALIAITAQLSGISDNMDMIIIGTIMMLVPGVAITNIMRDIIRGDLITGTTKIAEVILTAVAIALGVGIPISVINTVAGGLL